MTERVEITEEQIRQVCNETDPRDAFVMVISLLQRITIALESISVDLLETPTVLFEQADEEEGSQH